MPRIVLGPYESMTTFPRTGTAGITDSNLPPTLDDPRYANPGSFGRALPAFFSRNGTAGISDTNAPTSSIIDPRFTNPGAYAAVSGFGISVNGQGTVAQVSPGSNVFVTVLGTPMHAVTVVYGSKNSTVIIGSQTVPPSGTFTLIAPYIVGQANAQLNGVSVWAIDTTANQTSQPVMLKSTSGGTPSVDIDNATYGSQNPFGVGDGVAATLGRRFTIPPGSNPRGMALVASIKYAPNGRPYGMGGDEEDCSYGDCNQAYPAQKFGMVYRQAPSYNAPGPAVTAWEAVLRPSANVTQSYDAPGAQTAWSATDKARVLHPRSAARQSYNAPNPETAWMAVGQRAPGYQQNVDDEFYAQDAVADRDPSGQEYRPRTMDDFYAQMALGQHAQGYQQNVRDVYYAQMALAQRMPGFLQNQYDVLYAQAAVTPTLLNDGEKYQQ
jgi:hypothetical protein